MRSPRRPFSLGNHCKDTVIDPLQKASIGKRVDPCAVTRFTTNSDDMARALTFVSTQPTHLDAGFVAMVKLPAVTAGRAASDAAATRPE